MYFTNIFYKNYHSDKQIILNIGGARSSKSYSILQLLLTYFLNFKNKKFLITRKTRPSLKMSCWFDFIKLLKDNNLTSVLDINKSDLTVTNFKNNNFMFFRSLDDPEKIKSTDFNYIFMEEASEFTEEDYQQLKLRLSAKTKKLKNKFFIALNPVECWVQDKLMNNPEVDLIKSVYKDNPFLSQDYIKMLEDLKYQNDHLYRIYVLGEFSKLPNIIYSNYEFIDDEVYDKLNVEMIYGLDFGFNNPTALVEIKFYDSEIYVKELIYKTELTNADLINEMRGKILGKRIIFADSQEPARIKEIYNAGFNIHESDKNVNEGIDYLKRFKIHICKSSVNLQKEIKTYSWKIDKTGKILEEPVKFNDHLLDALRYAVYTYGLQVGDIIAPKLREKKPLNFIEQREELEKRINLLNKKLNGNVRIFKIIK